MFVDQKVPMVVKVHYEARYDKLPQHECPPGHNNEVVLKRAGFVSDTSKSLEANCAEEGERVFAASPGTSGCNHRLVVTTLFIDGVKAPPEQLIIVPVKIKQMA
jgi:hypothetical protein